MVPVKAAIVVATGIALLAGMPNALAHRSGCHRWHSCPSDTGSYVCGDLGYSNFCPRGTAPTTTQPKARTPAAQPSARAPAYTSPATSNSGQVGNRTSIKLAQEILAQLGYRPGPVDGVMGARTRAALRAFQASQGLPIDGKLSTPLLVKLLQTARAKN
jgi:hypothetical protein